MAVDTFFAYCGVYANTESALADYEAVHALHNKVGLIDAYDAAVIERKDRRQGQDRQEARDAHSSGWRTWWRSRFGDGPGHRLVPRGGGGGLLFATTGGGAMLGAVAGHAAAGMSRSDLKEIGESLDSGQAGLVVVAISYM